MEVGSPIVATDSPIVARYGVTYRGNRCRITVGRRGRVDCKCDSPMVVAVVAVVRVLGAVMAVVVLVAILWAMGWWCHGHRLKLSKRARVRRCAEENLEYLARSIKFSVPP